MRVTLFLIFLTINLVSGTALSDETKCTPLTTPVKYKFKKNDYVAAVLRKFKLEPVFGRNKYLDKTLALNNLKKADSVSMNDALLLPFPCEQEVQKWTVTPATDNSSRWILPTAAATTVSVVGMGANTVEVPLGVKEKTVFPAETVSTSMETTAAMTKVILDEKNSATTNPQDMDARLKEIISPPSDATVSPDSTKEKLAEIEKQKNPQDKEVSDALRYRMICEGEWDGNQCIPRNSIIYTSLAGWFNRYDGTDPSVTTNNKGVLLSRFNPEVTAGWQHYWLVNFSSRIETSFKQFSMLPEAREVPIEQSNKVLTDFSAEVRYEIGEVGFGLGFKQFDKLFYRFRFSGLSTPCIGGGAGFSGCGIFVHSASVPMTYIDASWLFYQAGKFSSDVIFTFGLLGSSTTAGWQIEQGSGWDFEFRVKHDRVQEYLYAGILYGQQSQNTSIEKQTSTELGVSLGYAWKLKDW